MNLNDKKATCKMNNYYILLTFLINPIVIGNRYFLLLLRKTLVKTKETLPYY